MPYKNIAVITGASSGFGKEFVKLMLKEPGIDEIWAIARNEEKLSKSANENSGNIKTFSIDLSDIERILEFKDTLKKENPNILFLFNNAGFAKFCSYGELGIKASVNMIDLNCKGVVAMGLACIPYMKKGSHIVNVSSQSSFQPLPYMNIYSATKAFVRNYSRALSVELKGKGISVTAVCPGWMDTSFFDRAEIGAKKSINNFSKMAMPDKVAIKAVKDAKKRKDMSVYSVYVKMSHVIAKILPQKTMMKIWLMQQRIKGS